MKIGILQLNLVVGDFVGNAAKILAGYHKLCAEGAELVVGSELAIFGYPPNDLLEMKHQVDYQLEVFWKLCEEIGEVGLIIGIAEWNSGVGKPLFNNAVFVQNGEVIGRRSKQLLPTYDVFDEKRYFESGPAKACIVNYRGKRVGLLVCEDAWGGTENPRGQRLYAADPVEDMLIANPDMLVIINASPYYWDKGNVRYDLVSGIVKRLGCSVIYVNQVGGYDDLIFDGRSFGLWDDGSLRFAAPSFAEYVGIPNAMQPGGLSYVFDEGDLGQVYQALVLGTRDYLRKTGYARVLIGESGGIDSALTTCIACDAVGPENVTAIGMPSGFSSGGSVDDSRELCKNLGVRFEIIPIATLYDLFGEVAKPVIGWQDSAEDFGEDVTQENVQARLRGMMLMAFSNRYKALVLSTGNKSELAVGYCTLYGDMVGGLAVISDVPKTLVFELARWINRGVKGEIIPRQIINKPPSAELRPGQKDQDSLPDYDTLDEILRLHIEEGFDKWEIVQYENLPPLDVEAVVDRVDRNEYKRRQAALGLKVTTKAFGSGRRFPIATKPADVVSVAVPDSASV